MPILHGSLMACLASLTVAIMMSFVLSVMFSAAYIHKRFLLAASYSCNFFLNYTCDANNELRNMHFEWLSCLCRLSVDQTVNMSINQLQGKSEPFVGR